MTALLEARELTKRFGGLTAVDRASLTVEEGTITALIGPNGAGKSTFFKMLAGEIEPTEGAVTFRGRPITGLGVARWCPGCGDYSILKSVQRTLAEIGLGDRAGVRAGELAYGEKRRLEIGLALATQPQLLLLDEPAAGMSPAEIAETVALIQRLRAEVTIVIVEHDMDVVFGLADRIMVMQNGATIAYGTPEEIRADARVREAYLGGADDA